MNRILLYLTLIATDVKDIFRKLAFLFSFCSTILTLFYAAFKCNDIFVVANSAHDIGILDIAVKELWYEAKYLWNLILIFLTLVA